MKPQEYPIGDPPSKKFPKLAPGSGQSSYSKEDPSLKLKPSPVDIYKEQVRKDALIGFLTDPYYA